jgi:hypothetical protein
MVKHIFFDQRFIVFEKQLLGSIPSRLLVTCHILPSVLVAYTGFLSSHRFPYCCGCNIDVFAKGSWGPICTSNREAQVVLVFTSTNEPLPIIGKYEQIFILVYWYMD